MSEDFNRKVIGIFSKHKNIPQKDIKSDLGYSCVVLEKDANGLKFNPEHLAEYAKSCNYIVRIMKTHNGETALFNYNVPNDEILDFIFNIKTGQIKGTIIEIDKYFPEDLA